MLRITPSRASLLLILLLSIQSAIAADYAVHRGALRLTYDPITLNDNGTLGLLGLHLETELLRYGYVGLAGFGAVSGEHGGFLVGGYSAGVNLPIQERISGNLGVFVGGGGGGAAPEGGGLMVRTHAGLGYLVKPYRLGAGVSHVSFPTGDINDSVQPYLSFQLPFTSVHASGWEAGELAAAESPYPLYDRPATLALSYKHYKGDQLSTFSKRPRNDAFSLIGVDWQQEQRKGYYYGFSAHGTYEGDVDSYAEVLLTAGRRWRLTPSSRLGAALSLGSGGGGHADTSGGMVGAISVNLEQALGDTLLVGLQGGYVDASSGDFRGTMAGLFIGVNSSRPVTTGWVDEAPTSLTYAPRHYRLRLMQQRYHLSSTIVQNGAPIEERVDLLGVQIDRFVNRHLYLSGQAMSAWQGEAGGYATGMVGGGLHLPVSHRIALGSELLAGAAGGGNIYDSDGLIMGGNVIAAFSLSEALELQVGAGRIVAHESRLDTRQFTAALAYRFTRPESWAD